MSLTVTLEPEVSALLRSAGVLDASGRVDSAWFQDPLGGIRRMLADPEQRAALLELLEQVLGTVGAAPSGSDWVPLLETEGRGNVYLTVTGEVIGVAAALATPEDADIRASAGVRVPLIDTEGDLRAIAGTAEGPLELAVEVEFDDAAVGGLSVAATVDIEGHASVRFVLEDVDVGAGPETLTVSSDNLGRDLVRAVQTLVGDVLADTLPGADRVADHLFGALGLDDQLPPLPIERIASDPAAIREWLAEIAGTPADLEVWFEHLTGLLGADPPTAADPLAATIVDLGGGAELVLRARVAADDLHLILEVAVPGSVARLEAAATLLALPLTAATPVRLVPRAGVYVRAPGGGGRLVDAAPDLQVGALSGGVTFDGVNLVPELFALDVVLENVSYPSLDLTDANAVVGAATAGLRGAIEAAIGDVGPARAVLALAGILPPRSDMASPHLIDVTDFAQGPTRAFAEVHRGMLGDAAHPWSHMLQELATLLDLGTVTGAGTQADPWRAQIAADGALRLDLAAWNARDATTPAGEHRLRIGLQASATVAPWTTRLLSEVLAFDLPAQGSGAVRIVGEQRLESALSPVPDVLSGAGIALEATALRAIASWSPGLPLAVSARAEDVQVSDGDAQAGPITLVFPPADPSAPDLGLGAALDELKDLLRLLVRHAVRSWGGDGVHALGELLGFFGDGPLLEPPDPNDLGSLFARPGDALREHLRALATELDSDGEPYATRALVTLTGLLRAQVPRASEGFIPRLDLPVTGAGTYEDPWSLPLLDEDGERVDALAWLEPAGPPPSWAATLAARVAGAADARTLAALARELGAFVDALPGWLDPDEHGDGLEALGAWIAGGDGVAPLASQLPALPGWAQGPPLSSAHDDQPRDPAAIALIAAQLAVWAPAGDRAVLLVGPPWSDHSIWDDLLAAVEPGRAAGAHFDLRGGAAPAAITAVATHYTADLDDDGSGDLASLAAQIGSAADRVVALTGVTSVVLVAHSTAGVAARVLAGDRPDVVRGIVTLGTPHAGGTPLPLTDPRLADAVRAARALGGAGAATDLLAGTALGAALERLEAAMAGAPGSFPPDAFAGTPGGTLNEVPGLALGSAIGGNPVASLAAMLAERVEAAAAARPAADDPTHFALGARIRLPIAADPGDPGLDASVRIDAGRIRLVPGAAEPARPAQAAALQVDALRPGGWLAGDDSPGSPRIRSAHLSLTLVPAATAVSVTPELVLRDVELGELRRDLRLGDTGLADALDLLGEALGMDVDLGALADFESGAEAVLRQRRDALLDAVEDALGGALDVPLAGLPLQVTLDRAGWTLRLRTTADLDLGEGITAGFDARLALATLTPTLDAALQVGAIRVEHEGAAGTLTLSAPPWLDGLVVLPLPEPEELRDTLVPLIPRVALSAALSAALSELLDVRGTIGALDSILADPGARLREIETGDIHGLLQAAARGFGVDDADGLALPGGMLLRASGTDPLRLELTGTLDLATAGDELRLGLRLDVAQDRRVDVGGSVEVDVALPGTWGRLELRFAASAADVELVVTPQNGQAIMLLPTFSGFGALVAAGATSLLPHLLQAIVEELRPAAGPPTGFLGAVLAVATTLGIYADDAQGFEEPARATRLAQMLEPGWIEQQVADPAVLAQLVAGLFGPPPLLQLPVGGQPVANGDRLSWQAQLPGSGTVALQVRLGAPLAVIVSVEELDAGPLVVQTARVGFEGDLEFDLALRLDPGGDLAFLAPVAELGLDDGRLSAALLPLGEAERADLELELAPQPSFTFTEAGALGLLASWGVPLVALLALRAAEDVLEDALWTNGPTPRGVLEDAGLVAPGSSPAGLALPLPPLEEIALGALQGLATNVTVAVTETLEIAIVEDGSGRKGIRLKGSEAIAGEELAVSMRFGEADWLDDPDAGVTLWVLRPPFALDLGLDVTGLGAIFSNVDGSPLLDGPVTIGQIGGLIFFAVDMQDPSGQPALTVGEIGGAVEVNDAQIAISSDDGDSIVQRLLPPELQAPFSFAVEGHVGRGFELHGGIGSTPGQIELTFPLNLDIGGIVQLDEVFLAAGRSGNAMALLAAISGGAELGPVAVAVTRVGARARFTASGAQLEFKPPDGLGLSIDSPSIRLGGFLLVDEARGRYVGAVEIAIVEKFSLVAIGIITTKRPDGTPGFSLLFLVAITFPVPIPLGYGFFFAGAGGLLGLNRGVDLDRLRLGLRSGTADSILFPTDVVARIDTIVRDLEESFPIADGRFLIAPMAMITWSSPPLITAKVGIVLELGSPFRLAILGVIQLQLPTPDEAVVSLKVAFLGAIDIPGSMLSFDASIYDSYLGYADFKLSLEGDMALRISWGPQPDFLTSVGGFHPAFRPGAHLRLPPMRRMSISLLKDNPRITLSAYFAVTTNTVQFGAKLELVFRFGGFGVEGELGFDVLVQIVPLRLEAHIWGRVSIMAGGSELLSISLDLTLEGPTPWIARGKGKFKILFISVEVSLELRMGEEAPSTLPQVTVLPKLLEALRDDSAWTSELGDRANELVLLAPPPAGTLVIDAGGLLTVSQRVLPLSTDFTLFGTARPNDVGRVSVHELRIGADSVAGTEPAAPTRDVTEAFAPAAFRAMPDEDKLRAPAFEQRTSGVQSVRGDALSTDSVLSHPVAYETIVFDTEAGEEPARGMDEPQPEVFDSLVPGGRIGTSPLSKAQARRSERGTVADVKPAQELYAVTRIGDISPLDENGDEAAASAEGVLVGRTDAEERRAALIARGRSDDLQILPEAQVAA
jgi:hypothetical protein